MSPTGVKFQVSLLSRVVGWLVGWLGGGWGEIEIKANSAQLELELGLSLAIYEKVDKDGGVICMPSPPPMFKCITKHPIFWNATYFQPTK